MFCGFANQIWATGRITADPHITIRRREPKSDQGNFGQTEAPRDEAGLKKARALSLEKTK